MKKTVIALILLCAAAAGASADGPIISSITVSGNRVKESVIRKNLGFREGDAWSGELAGKACEKLFRLKIFKDLDIAAVPGPSSGTVHVNVNAVDGWFAVPIPMVAYQGGEQRFMLILASQNAFRSAERATVFTSFKDGGASALFIYDAQDWSLMFGERTASVVEHVYADGAVSQKVFDDQGFSHEKPEDLGAVTADFTRDETEPLLIGGLNVFDGIKVSAGIKSTEVGYRAGAAGAVPGDAGIMNAVILGIGSDDRNGIRDSDGIGRMFGLGMAEVKDLIRNGRREPSVWQWNLWLQNSGKLLPSDNPYTKTSFSVARKTVFRRRNSLLLSSTLVSGTSLPPSQMAATNIDNGMRGYYARELRGDTAVNSYLAYTHPFLMTMRGYFSVEGFYDWGVSYAGGGRRDRTGAGINMSYRFWRFPLPLGMGFARSFDDDNWQTVFSVGGRF